MRIAIIGTGYVGLTTGVCFANFGNTVTCLDIDETKIERLARGECVIFEPGLEELLKKNQKEGRLFFTTNTQEAVSEADVIFFTINTPEGEYGKANLSYLYEAVSQCASYLKPNVICINKSTAPVGTVKKLKAILAKLAHNIPFSVASNPEFLSEGTAVNDFLHPDRIVIGIEQTHDEATLRTLYSPIIGDDHPLVVTTIESAELIKYAANTFLALKISFVNEIADYCELVGADVKEVARGIGYDKRIGHRFLRAGIGYGGSCFGKDVLALTTNGEEQGFEFKIIKALSHVNNGRYRIVLQKIKKYFPDLRGKTMTLLGLSYKPMTDDVRDAPSHRISFELLDAGARVVVYDPVSNEAFKKQFSRSSEIKFASSSIAALTDADCAIIVTEWDEFRNLHPKTIQAAMKGTLVVDGRNIFDRREIESAGLIYEGVGRS